MYDGVEKKANPRKAEAASDCRKPLTCFESDPNYIAASPRHGGAASSRALIDGRNGGYEYTRLLQVAVFTSGERSSSRYIQIAFEPESQS
jgi:hypothetical protein